MKYKLLLMALACLHTTLHAQSKPNVLRQPAEFYDLGSDLGETKNLAAEKPELVAKLVAAIAEWEKETVAPAFERPRSQQRNKAAEEKAKTKTP